MQVNIQLKPRGKNHLFPPELLIGSLKEIFLNVFKEITFTFNASKHSYEFSFYSSNYSAHSTSVSNSSINLGIFL
jgi:hypothetical protein